ncbi:peptidylprolyl isomerase [Gammaproteobacteria bacterium]|nr:peptidylprolyl isomerase [Gammaproteobacteria bacterium]MDA9815016.1 peptidylprolyl isomerase [Gammaproteobacteria bacterium]MDB4848564.1 peptidylprolyl isomerase [Gammaproteobacteria bacterium]MDC1075030.1 peptidylprolyl isomerase [Gammaproteobacteria bacterium]
MKKTILILFSVISISIHSAIEILDRVAVIVDDGLIMQSQINSDLDEMVQRYEEQNIPKPDIKVLRNQVIESLIIEELQLQLAERYGIRVSDEELNATITRIAANNNLSLEEFIIYLQNEGESYEDFREDVKKQITIQRIQRGRVGSEIDITEKEFEAFLKTDESLIQLEPELLVRQILISKYEDATLIFENISNGQPFEEVAKTNPLNKYNKNEGLMDWKKAIDMPKIFSEAINDKDVGFITKPIKSGAGYHILKLENKRGDFVRYEDQWLARHILLIPSTIRNEEQTKNELTDIRNRILDGEDFVLLAASYSEDPGSAKNKGELGWLGKGVLAAEFEKTMIEIEPGKVSDIFKTEFGFHFLEVLDTRNHDMTRELIKDEAYAILYQRKYDEELENTLRSIRAEAFVEFKDLD